MYWRTVDELQQRSALQARVLALVTAGLLIVLVVWTTTLHAQYARRLTSPWIGLPALSILCGLFAGFALGFRSRFDCMPLFAALGVFVLAFGLVLAALYPLIIPPDLTLQVATSSPNSQVFMLAGFTVLVPITLIYNTYGFRVFSGKIGTPPQR
ncbi:MULTISPECIES: cytochrome d ubiquinol oxidase subunit II [unclassified Pseudomonas]|uniref:cytochrome d ubiquinol oxidase subunit II n=1 Tax=unclassified Pseudomonas TaxID=196821 RepID=UPI002114E0CB|nr:MULTISPECIES: cytochrome d ubiquinol oxidase subunit II [unclassified Pseudomonas]